MEEVHAHVVDAKGAAARSVVSSSSREVMGGRRGTDLMVGDDVRV